MRDDVTLLREYLENDSQEAFRALVERHVRLVYSTAQRLLNKSELAEEVTQTVFLILARKGRKLKGTSLAGWLHRTTRFAALQALRMECRRQRREETFAALANGEDRELGRIRPHLDEALNKLGETDRNAVILRFMEEKSLREIGEALGISEDAARMRVNRAVTKLQASFGKAGVAISSTALLSTLSSASAIQVPSGVVSSVIAIVGVKGSGMAAATIPLVKETLKSMTLAKIKTASAMAAIVVALGVTTAIVTSNNAAETKPKLRAAELLAPPDSVGGIEIRGRSTYSIFSTNGTVTGGDTNDFSVTMDGCSWRMMLDHPSFSHPPTQLGDDGTNYIIFAPGSAGTSRIEGRSTRYEATATIYKSGSAYPRHHGIAVWLLFASKCAMPAPSGDIGNLLNPDSEVKLAYERQDDLEKNAFGPSMVRIFAKVRVGDVRTNRLVTEVEVMESERKDGYATPRSAELRVVSERPLERTQRIWSTYRLSNISLKRNVTMSWPPPITKPTCIQEFRNPFYSFEYVSTNWTTADEAMQLMRSGKVHPH